MASNRPISVDVVVGVGGDAVKLLFRRQQVVPPVVDTDLDSRIPNDIKVVLRKVRRHDLWHQRLDLRDRFFLKVRFDAHGAGRHTRATADHKNTMRILGNQRRQVPERIALLLGP